jgi:Mg2+/Co2+ transporter CorB
MVIIPAYSAYLGDSGIAIATNPLAMIVVVAESTPTAKWRNKPKIIKSTIGSRILDVTVNKSTLSILVYLINIWNGKCYECDPAVIFKANLWGLRGKNSWERG